MTRTIVGFEVIMSVPGGEPKATVYSNKVLADKAVASFTKKAASLGLEPEITGPTFTARRLIMNDEDFEKYATEVQISAEELLKLEQDYSTPRTRKSSKTSK